jgi:hypothetical protein
MVEPPRQRRRVSTVGCCRARRCFYLTKLFGRQNWSLSILADRRSGGVVAMAVDRMIIGLVTLALAGRSARGRGVVCSSDRCFVLGFFNVYLFLYTFVADHFQYLPSLGLTRWSAGAPR